MSNKPKINLSNVLSFIEGNIKYYQDKFLSSPQYLQEQYHYRLSVCNQSCIPANECEYCTCPPLRKAWVVKSCNDGKKFPDLMDKESWETYKINNDIDITTILKNHGIQ